MPIHSLKCIYRLFLMILAVGIAANTDAQFALNVETANLSSDSKSVRTLENFVSTAQFSKYGGCLTRKVTAKGYFYTSKIDNVWYVVDPEGYLFITIGINSVVKGGGFVLPDSLRKISCNTMGCWSDETINTGTSNKIAYSPRWNLMLNYKNTSQRTKDLYNLGVIPVFDSEFSTYCMQVAATSIAPLKSDPYIFGHFSDNELPIYDNTTYGNLLDRFLAITNKTDANYLAADNWMKLRSGAGYTVTAADRLEFHGYVAGTYYKTCSTAIKKYDPNHLYLGSRLHGGAKSIAPIFREAGKYVDIISINTYGVWTPQTADMNMWSIESGKPFFVTEFYAKAEDSGLDNIEGAGWLVKTQKDRALFFENFTLALLGHPGNVGFHYFKYIDNPTVNTGLVNSSYKWYSPMKESFTKIGKDIYLLRGFLLDGYSGTGVATVYTGVNYLQQARLLKKGNYPLNSLINMGIDAALIASIKVKPNCVVTLFSSDQFTGDSVIITGNNPDLSSLNFINKTKSLRVIDNNVTGINDLTGLKSKIKIYPNPFTESFSIDFPEETGEIKISFYGLTGHLVKKMVANSQNITIDTWFLQPGIYLVRVEGNNVNETGKILKMQ